jgi:HPt (histidine-containing phosphotransfer) domain-containing protein
MNTGEGIARVAGNKTIYLKILDSYLNKPVYPALREALAQGDLAGAELHAHSLKGVSANLSLTEVYRISTELDTLLKTGQTDAALEAELAAAVEATDRHVAWVRANLA